MAAKKGGLGRVLDALFADAVPVYENEDAANDTFKDTDKKARTGFATSNSTTSCRISISRARPSRKIRSRSWRLLSKSMGLFSRLL